MSTAFYLENCEDVTFDNVRVVGMDTAFEIYDSQKITMDRVDIIATRTALKGERITGLTASRVAHSSTGWLPTATSLAMAIRRISRGNV